jgi:hypothetical protein
MVIDTSFFAELYEAEHITEYHSLMDYMKQFTFEFYDKNHIYVEEHYYENSLLYLPATLHFLAHILLARQSNEHEKKRSYSSAIQIQKRVKLIKSLFPNAYKEAVAFYSPHSKERYIDQKGPIKARDRLEQLSTSMSNLDRSVLKKRNKSISESRKKRVKHLETGMIYESTIDASQCLGINVNNIRKCCRNEIESFHGYHFEYITRQK